MLASDLNNPDFVGAVNPDDLLFVEFYMHEPEDWNKSMETGKKVKGPAMPYVRIQKPGDKTSVIETAVRDDHKARWPNKWLYFQMKEGMISQDTGIPGWKIEEWDVLTADQVRELKYLRFSVVEQIAGASDEQVQRMGMGGLGLREQARQALRNRMGVEVKEAMAAKDKELADMKERLAKLESLLTTPEQRNSGGVSESQAPVPEDGPHPRDAFLQSKLVAQYVEKFGKKPHHKLGVEKIREALG